jgi:hypothetical protein
MRVKDLFPSMVVLHVRVSGEKLSNGVMRGKEKVLESIIEREFFMRCW